MKKLKMEARAVVTHSDDIARNNHGLFIPYDIYQLLKECPDKEFVSSNGIIVYKVKAAVPGFHNNVLFIDRSFCYRSRSISKNFTGLSEFLLKEKEVLIALDELSRIKKINN